MANSTRKTAGTRGKTARSGHEALSACVAKKIPENEPAAAHGGDTAEPVEAPVEDAAEEQRENAEVAAEAAEAMDLDEASRHSLRAFVEANVAIMNGMNTLSAEMAAFGGKRLNANLEHTQSLVDCDDPEKALRVQSEYFEAAMRQYLDQAGNVMQIMASISRGFWRALDPHAQQSLRDRGGSSDPGKGG